MHPLHAAPSGPPRNRENMDFQINQRVYSDITTLRGTFPECEGRHFLLHCHNFPGVRSTRLQTVTPLEKDTHCRSDPQGINNL